MKMTNHGLRAVLLGAGALGFALAALPAAAADYSDPDDDAYYDDSYSDDSYADDSYADNDYADEESVIVTAPFERLQPGQHIGTPERIALSQDVPYGDLDLATNSGARELRVRIRDAARDVCYQLDVAYPGVWGDSVTCVRRAVQGASTQADALIQDARYAYNY
jgi:UrcA family protein